MKKQSFKIRLLPTILFAAVVILIVKAHSYRMNFSNMPDVPLDGKELRWDLFCYVKANVIFAITIYAVVTMVYLLIIGQLRIKKTLIYIPMLCYTSLVVFSYIFSDYKWLAFSGSIGRFEGTRTILCYMFMLFYTINVVDEIKDVITIITSTIVGTLIACIVGLTQFLGCDIFSTKLVGMAVAGSDTLTLDTVFNPGQVYQTVANMNYVGMYLALIIPILIYAIAFLWGEKNKLKLTENGIYNGKRLLMIGSLGLMLLLIAANVAGAGSLGGVLGISVAVLMLIIVMAKKKSVKAALLLVLAVSFAGALVGVYVTGDDNPQKTGHKQIEFIETGIDVINMSFKGNELSIVYHREDGTFEVRDGEGNSLEIFCFAGEDGIYNIEEDCFGYVKLIPFVDINNEACISIEVRADEREYYGFTFYENGAKFLNPFGEEISLKKIDSFLFKGHLSAGSGRGYIWSRTLPLLKDRVIIGSGADTFLAVFPNNDYAGKYSAGMSQYVTIEKPHNMYLGMAVGTGVLSVMAFLAMVGMILWKAFHLGEDKILIKVIATGLIGFLVAGLFNDSTVGVMPMFYGMLGIVAAIGIC